MAELIFAEPARGAGLVPMIEKMVSDPSPAVRARVVETLTALLNVDRDLAIQLFERLTEKGEEPVGTEMAVHFLVYAGRTHSEQVQPILNRMLESTHSEVALAGVRATCILACVEPGFEHLVAGILESDPVRRKSAAEVFAEGVWQAPPGGFVEEALGRLLRDADPDVRKHAGDLFRQSKGGIAERPGLIDGFISSPAFPEHAFFLFHDLLESPRLLPEGCCQACKLALDVGQTPGRTAREISQLLLRIYTQSGDPDLQNRCLDLIDRMIEDGAYDAVEALGVLDR
jgi:hypothetical protein